MSSRRLPSLSSRPYAASVADHALIAGSTARFEGYGSAPAMGVLLIGIPTTSIDLAMLGIGGTNCDLHTLPFASLPVAFGALPRGRWGVAANEIKIPADASSLQFPFRAQFVAATMPIETTNALDFTVAPRLPTLGMSTVVATRTGPAAPTSGRTRANRAPIIRFDYL